MQKGQVVVVADRIAIDADVLVHHATRVEHVSDDVRTAADTARGSTLGAQALGPLCSFLLVPTCAAAASGHATITAAATMVEWTGQRARAWAQQATDTEHRALNTLRAVYTELA